MIVDAVRGVSGATAVIAAHIRLVLWATGGQVSAAAELLGIHRRSLERWLADDDGARLKRSGKARFTFKAPRKSVSGRSPKAKP
jgi:hypothetical protein